MGLTRRDFAKFGIGLAALRYGVGDSGSALAQQSASHVGTGVRVHGHSLIGDLKYAPDFSHFGYVNPSAPKGGSTIDYGGTGFDTFNGYVVGGRASTATSYVIESLMKPSLDEGSTHYGLLAEWMEIGPDDAWVAFRLRDEARFHDGKPVTAEDVIFSFTMLTTKGQPFYRAYWANVSSARDVGDRTVLFEFDQTGNRELPHIMGQLDVLPAHWWAERDFEKPILEPLLGSGPYKIVEFEAGGHVDLERTPDYWGANLPINIGYHNFDKLRLEYFGDDAVAFEAFKAGRLDLREESTARRWALEYEFPAIKSGAIVREEPKLEGPKSVAGYFWNVRRKKFADRRTREALNLLMDFEYLNRTTYYGQYARPNSYFQGTPELMATGMPDEAELALLEPYRDALPPELFERPFEQPETDGSGNLERKTLRKARKLFEAAGWKTENGKLVDEAGAPFEIEFLLISKALEPTVRPFIANLERLGVVATMRIIDVPQYVSRVDNYDYDTIAFGVANSESPGNEQRDMWGSKVVAQPGGRNYAGVSSPAVDDLIEKIVFAKDRASLAAACRALDRILLFEYYLTLRAYTPFERIAYWKENIAHPETPPSRSIGYPQVWWSAKAEDAG